MGDEFYSSIKLITGEEIFSLVFIDDNDGDPLIVMQNPVILKFITGASGQFIKIKPWMELPSDDFYMVRMDKIITMTEISNEKIIACYNAFLEKDEDDIEKYDSQEETGKVKITDNMGYISSVKEARRQLENIFKKDIDIKDNKES
jgi:hypothetical protein